jgi:hypothetical protein
MDLNWREDKRQDLGQKKKQMEQERKELCKSNLEKGRKKKI